ncbi:MAG TPA: hypothetical protein VGX00_06380 [Thermoplasmata archaeon]|nr:hypothetical protein [Thermoplasmata archaeon]
MTVVRGALNQPMIRPAPNRRIAVRGRPSPAPGGLRHGRAHPRRALGWAILLALATLLGPGASLATPPTLHSANPPVGGSSPLHPGPSLSASVTVAVSGAWGAGSVRLSSVTGTVGSVVSVSGSGYAGSEVLQPSFGGRALALTSCSVGQLTVGGLQLRATSSGNFDCQFTVPAAPHGSHALVVGPSTSVAPPVRNWTTLATLSGGAEPWGASYDSGLGRVYAVDLSGSSVRVFNDSRNTVVATIPVGNRPHGSAYDSGMGEVFVANYDPGGPGSVSVIRDSTLTNVATINVSSEPFDVAYDPARGEVFVTDLGSNNVSVISDTSNRVVATIPVASQPQGIAYDSGKGEMFVATHGGPVQVISDSSNTVVANLTVPNDPWGVAYDPAKGLVFVTQNTGTNVSVISDATNAIVATVNVGAYPSGTAYDPDAGAILVDVINSVPPSLVVINDTNRSIVATATVGANPVMVAYDTGVHAAYVMNQIDGTVTVLGRGSSTALATIPVGNGPWGAAYDPVRGDVYVTNLDATAPPPFGGTVSVVSDTNESVTGQIMVGYRPHGIAYDAARGEMFVANYDPGGPGTVSVINDSVQRVTTNVTVGSDPFDLVYDSARNEVFVTNFGSGTVSVISDTTDTVVATVSVAAQPQGIAYDSGKGELFVASYGGSVQVVSDRTNAVVANVSLAEDPWGVGYDPARGEVYVTEVNGTNLTAISDATNTVVSSVQVGEGPSGIAYDPNAGAMLVDVLNATGAGGNNGTGVTLPGAPGALVVVNDTNVTVSAMATVGANPVMVAYDGGVRAAFVVNQYDSTVTVVQNVTTGVASYLVLSSLRLGSPSSGAAGTTIVLSGDGYAAGAPLTAAIGGTEMTAVAPCTSSAAGSFAQCAFTVPPVPVGSYPLTVRDRSADVNSNPLDFTVTPVATYGLTFIESGLPASTAWTVVLGSATPGVVIDLTGGGPPANVSRSSNGAAPIDFQVSEGRFHYSASADGFAPGYGNATVSGAGPSRVTVTFIPLANPIDGHPHPTAHPTIWSGFVLGVGILTIGAVGLGVSVYRYRSIQRQRGQSLVERLYEVADGVDPAFDATASAPPPRGPA